MAKIGYARVSTRGQEDDSQADDLTGCGCETAEGVVPGSGGAPGMSLVADARSGQRLAAGGNARVPARPPGGCAGLKRGLDGGGGGELGGLRIDGDVPAQQHAAGDLPGVPGPVLRPAAMSALPAEVVVHGSAVRDLGDGVQPLPVRWPGSRLVPAVRGMAVCRPIRPEFPESAMTSPGKSRHVEVKDGDQTVAAAEVTAVEHAGGTVRTSLHPSSGHTPPGSRASLVDAVMDLPGVQASSRLEATVPLGDAPAPPTRPPARRT